MTFVINRYYDPTTDEFLSIDPEVATTDQPYVFTNDDPLNAEDPLGDCWGWCTFTDAAHAVTSAASWVGRHPLETFGIVLGVAAAATGVGALGFGLIAATAAGEAATAATGTALSLGFAASLTGAGATALDGDSCVHGNKGACVGAYLGGVGFLTGGFATGGVLFEAGSLSSAISLGLGGVSASFGVASLLFDGVRVVTTSTASKLEKENLKKF